MMSHFPFAMLMYSMIISSTIMAISSSNWLFMWLSLELNMMTFLPSIMMTKSNQELEAAIKYFLMQALGSSILLLYSYSLWYLSPMSPISITLLLFSLLIKLGAAPFHFWYPSVMSSSNWLCCLMLSTWQKLAPLLFIIFLSIQSNLIALIAALNAIIGGLYGMNQSKLRSIMAYSSLVHIGWMIALIYMSATSASIIYFFIYSIIITPLFIIFMISNMKHISFSTKFSSMSSIIVMLIPLMLLSLAGIPPLTGFIPKWMSMFYLWSNPALLITLIMGSLMSTYYYISLIFASAMSYSTTMTSSSYFYTPNMWSIIPISTMTLMIIPLSII